MGIYNFGCGSLDYNALHLQKDHIGHIGHIGLRRNKSVKGFASHTSFTTPSP